MKKTRAISLLLSLSLICAMLVPGAAAFAENETDSGMVISKTATANNDGSYTITLEAYATGEKVISEVTEDVPTDIVLVLDQSGSMEDPIGAVSFSAYSDRQSRNNQHYDRRHNGGSANLWYKDGEKYYSVSVTKTITYTALSESLDNSDYYYYRNNLYEKVGDDEYEKVGLTYSTSGFLGLTYTFTYTFSNGTSVVSVGRNTKPYSDLRSNGHAPLYTPAADNNDTVYTYTYTDADGVTHTIGTSTGANTRFTPVFYQRSTTTSGGGSRLNALKSAANAFANAVAAKAAGADGDINTTADNINHRIAVVGYADTDWDYGYNTGVFIGSTLNRYENNAAGVYSTALQDMSTTNGKSNVAASFNALQASGATRTDYGLTMANGILNANPVPTGETRNRVVIVFTDGSPTDSNGFELDVANAAINNANAIKDSGATVYSIGIFSGADASSAGKEPDEDYYDDGIWGRNYTDAEMSAACNWFMQKVSSNNGTPRTPSYYLSAGDSASLNSIFQQISNQIETGGAETTLGSETVIKDIIAPQFELPANATTESIKLYTAESNGSVNSWKTRETFAGSVSLGTNDNSVSVSGFSFKDNWCGNETFNGQETFHDGKKLIIEFTVQPKTGFLGGNNVYTNDKAGVYADADATDPVLTFPRPQVNVPIKDVTVTAADKNVYLLGGLTAAQLKDGATVTVGEDTKAVSLDLSKANENYGLEAWQTEYVDITVTVKDNDGKAISDKLADLTEDTTYTVEVTVAPKTVGTSTDEKGDAATAKSGVNSPAAKINVFKPELTFKDSEVYYGDTVPAEYSNLTSTVWKHGETLSTAEGVTMIGDAPTLALTYTPDSTKIASGKVNTKQDIAVDVAVKIGETDVTGYTTFVHTKCADDNTCTDPDNGKFWLHVNTCQLTITKTGGTANEPYVFTVKKDGTNYTEVTIVGNGSATIHELPVGTYTIEEDTGWSWRFTPSYSLDRVTLSASSTAGTITCTNTLNEPYWLNGFSAVVKNIFGTTNN